MCPDERPYGYGMVDQSELALSVDLKKQNRKIIKAKAKMKKERIYLENKLANEAIIEIEKIIL